MMAANWKMSSSGVVNIARVVTVILSLQYSARGSFYVVPSNDSCPLTEMPCLSLDELAVNTSRLVGGNYSTITILFLPGDHSLGANLIITGKQNVSLLSTRAVSGTSTINIHCSNSSSLMFSRIGYVHISGLHFVNYMQGTSLHPH